MKICQYRHCDKELTPEQEKKGRRFCSRECGSRENRYKSNWNMDGGPPDAHKYWKLSKKG